MHNECRVCSKQRQRDRRARLGIFAVARDHGLTSDEFLEMMRLQAGLCAICGAPGDLHIDHDHKTGQVRAALCKPCNVGLGHFQDNPARLRAAATYATMR